MNRIRVLEKGKSAIFVTVDNPAVPGVHLETVDDLVYVTLAHGDGITRLIVPAVDVEGVAQALLQTCRRKNGREETPHRRRHEPSRCEAPTLRLETASAARAGAH